MRAILLGKGAREHAMAWKLCQSKSLDALYVVSGNPGIDALSKSCPLSIAQLEDASYESLALWARQERIDLLIVGPEQPLAQGVCDRFLENNIPCMGPTRAAAQLEASKVYAKEFMAHAQIPTARFATCESFESARVHLQSFSYPVVVKADGLAAGKGVVICETASEALLALEDMFQRKRFGSAASRVVLEEFLCGPELSLMIMAHGESYVELETAQDHKRLHDHDQGPNTGGMGAYSPAATLTDTQRAHIRKRIIEPTLREAIRRDHPFVGVLYIGLILTTQGPMVLEYNVRMGDPETQVILPRLESDYADLCMRVAQGQGIDQPLRWSLKTCLGTVLAAKGYPEHPQLGDPITMREAFAPNVTVFHAGTALREGRLVTNGGRVLTVTALADTPHEAKRACDSAISNIHFEGMQYRSDIGYQILKNSI